jgi:DNA-directed RNA polymerase subunit RPC12/RpoP
MVSSSDDLLICTACGTQFEEKDPKALTSCRICDDRLFYPNMSFTAK